MTPTSDTANDSSLVRRPPAMPGRLPFSDDAVNQAIEQKGYVVLPLLDGAAVARLAAAYEAHHCTAVVPPTQQSRGFRIANARAVPTSGFHATMYAADIEFRRAVFSSIVAVMEEPLRRRLNGYDLRVANFVVKEIGSGTEVPFHQDWSFVDESRFLSLNVWCPVVDVCPENGCMHVVPGSHRLSVDPRAHCDPHPFIDILPRLHERHVQAVPMAAGEALFYDTRLLHGSTPNCTDRRRVSTACVLVPSEAPLLHAVRTSPMQVEQFEVDVEFFFRHAMGGPPSGCRSVGVFTAPLRQYSSDVITELEAL